MVNAYFEFKMVNDEKVKEKALNMLLDHALANSPQFLQSLKEVEPSVFEDSIDLTPIDQFVQTDFIEQISQEIQANYVQFD